jgi:hypothetical protein
MLLRLLATYVLRRLLGGGRRSRRARYGYGGWGPGARRRSAWGGYAPRYGYGGRGRRSGGFGFFGPFPTYSTRTRRGSRVTVSGCCLPIPLALVLAMFGTGRALIRR